MNSDPVLIVLAIVGDVPAFLYGHALAKGERQDHT
jgi:hypothetical protein